MFPPLIDYGTCQHCKGSGFKKDSDFTKLDCICEETGNKLFEVEEVYFHSSKLIFNGDLVLLNYEDKINYDKLVNIKYFKLWDTIQYNEDGLDHHIYINANNRLEPFYSLNDSNINNYTLKPVEDPLFPFIRK